MTVITWDTEYLVVDGRSTMGDRLISNKERKIREVLMPNDEIRMAAFCGAVMVIEPWLAHIAENGFEAFDLPDDAPFPGMYDTKAVILDAKGKLIELDTNGLWATVDYPSAWGSGQEIAQHFLNKGMSAVEAAQEACRTYTSCGGQITAYHWAKREFHVYEV